MRKTPQLAMLTLLAAVVATAAGAIDAVSTSESVQEHWVIRDLGTFGGTGSEALAVNESGQVLVAARSAKVVRYVVWRNGTAQSIPLRQAYGEPLLNDRGQVLSRHADTGGFRYLLWQDGRVRDLGVVNGGVAVSFDNRGIAAAGADLGGGVFLWKQGRWKEIPRVGSAKASTVGGSYSIAWDVNSRGQAAGDVSDESGIDHAALWQNGSWRRLVARQDYQSSATCINEQGVVTGWLDVREGKDSFTSQVFFWKNGVLRKLGTLGGPASRGGCTNGHGQVVGWADTKRKNKQGGLISHAFLWQNGHMTDLGTVAGSTTSSRATMVNEGGQIIGSSDTTLLRQGGTDAAGHPLKGEPIPRAFVWRNSVMTALPSLPGGKETGAVAINNRGQIAGWSTTKNGRKHAVIWEPLRG